MASNGKATDIDGLFARARGLLLGRSALLAGLFLAALLQVLVVGGVLLVRAGVSPGLLRLWLPLTAALAGAGALLWFLLAHSSRWARRRTVGLLTAHVPTGHADIEAYYASCLIGGIRDGTVREICRRRLAEALTDREP
ncbi:MAG: hypothetical protein HN904_21505, partial [Victivallales bacterium]|nr:hypothetical protein [Victivallales bacterium]